MYSNWTRTLLSSPWTRSGTKLSQLHPYMQILDSIYLNLPLRCRQQSFSSNLQQIEQNRRTNQACEALLEGKVDGSNWKNIGVTFVTDLVDSQDQLTASLSWRVDSWLFIWCSHLSLHLWYKAVAKTGNSSLPFNSRFRTRQSHSRIWISFFGGYPYENENNGVSYIVYIREISTFHCLLLGTDAHRC